MNDQIDSAITSGLVLVIEEFPAGDTEDRVVAFPAFRIPRIRLVSESVS